MSDKELNIALAADSNYIVPITVTLQSLFEHNQGKISIYLLFLEAQIRATDLEALSHFINQRGGQFIPLKIQKEQLNDFPETRHGKAALLRLCLPTLLQQVDKILYLDGDIVIEDSLQELFQTDISAHYIAAAKDTIKCYHPNYLRLLGIDEKHDYFNSGVTLLNLHLLREVNLPEKLNKFIYQYNKYIFAPDQDALNYICQNGKTLYIHPRYNMNYNVEKDVAIQVWGKRQIQEAKSSPAIIHFIGPIKPWSILCTHPQRKKWWKYLDKTPFAGYKPKDSNTKNRIRKCYLLLAKPIERLFSLENKKKIGKLMPTMLKKQLKRSLLKSK